MGAIAITGAGVGGTANCNTMGVGALGTANNVSSSTATFSALTMNSSSSIAVLLMGSSTSGQTCMPASGTSKAATGDINIGIANATGNWSTATCSITSSVTTEIVIEVSAPLPGCTGPPCPTIVQDETWGTNNGTENGNGFVYNLPNPTLGNSSTEGNSSNNLLVVGFSWSGAATVTSLADDQSNTYTSGASCGDTGTPKRNVAIYYALGAKKSTQIFTLTFSTTVADVHFRATELYNVAVSSAIDGTAVCSASTSNFGPIIAAGSITTTVDNDFIYQYGYDSGAGFCCVSPVTGYYPGRGFSLLPSDRHIAHFSQYIVWGAHGAINPTMVATQASAESFNTAAIAFKAATAGTAPSATDLRIVRMYSTSISGTPFVVQWPCTGNLSVLAQGENATDHPITAVSDAPDVNTWTQIAMASNSYPQMWYAAGQACTQGNYRTVSITSSGGVTGVPLLYDIVNAAASPKDIRGDSAAPYTTQSNAGGASCPGAAGSDTDDVPDITPTTGFQGVIIGVLNNGVGPTCSMMHAGQVADFGWYTGDSDASTLMNSSNGFMHQYYSTNAAVAVGYHWANATATNGYAVAVSFKGPASAPSGKNCTLSLMGAGPC